MELKFSYSNQILSSAEMKELEAEVCAKSGKNLLDLMEAAGGQVAAFIEGEFASYKDKKSKILIVSGPGNNGGDGLVVGRLLLDAGFNIQVILIGSSKYSSELQHQLETYRNKNIPLSILVEHESSQVGYISLSRLTEMLSETNLVVDALLGTGQKGNPRDLIKLACEAIVTAKSNHAALKIISIDVPTGINCDCGTLYQPYISPDFTVVIQHLKRGLVQFPALDCLGKIILIDAGIDCRDLRTIGHYVLLDKSSPLLFLKPRSKTAHKGDFGHILVLAGSPEMPGAALLSAIAALRSGAGLVTALNFSENSAILYPEIMHLQAYSGLNSELVQRILPKLEEFSCILIGPGLGSGQAITSFVFEILREVQIRNIPCIVDADALNALAELIKLGVPVHLPSAILTPHPGEAARLLQLSTQQIQSGRFEAAEKIANLCQATVVLKGASSVCYDGKDGVVNSTGGPCLATAGSGDVLAGMIAAFFASGANSLSAASLGVFLHGIAGELASQVHAGPIIASDIINKIPFAIGKHVSGCT